ncbi:hypothetical protein [Eisenibacter elegans]|uniref:hypothetical protein n=1 Tax=Eisenibacter elegans TaxID=997 RepID=UPI0012B575D9|nr:hypothetical protein [Eisenibacter elegans]
MMEVRNDANFFMKVLQAKEFSQALDFVHDTAFEYTPRAEFRKVLAGVFDTFGDPIHSYRKLDDQYFKEAPLALGTTTN